MAETQWDNEDVKVEDEACPLHPVDAEPNCWPCHVAGVLAGEDELIEPAEAPRG